MRYAFRQIEASPKNEPATNWAVDSNSLSGVAIEVNSGAVIPSVGQHATAVAQFLAGPNSPSSGICTDIFVTHSSYFKGAACLGDGRVWTPTTQYPTNPFPFLLTHDGDPGIRMVINCSYGDNVAKDFVTGQEPTFHPEQNTFNRLSDYVRKTGYLIIAALPDKGMLTDGGYIQDFPCCSDQVIAVGSADLGHEEPYGRKPDCVAYGYTSFTAPQVASLALRLLYEADKLGKTLTAEEVKTLIYLGCDKALTPYSQGAGAINVKKTLAIFQEKYNSAMADSTTTTPVPIPTVIKDPNFQTPSVGVGPLAYKYNPTGGGWTYLSGAGLAGNGSDFTNANAVSPNGTQVAFVQNDGSISQPVTLEAGTWTWSFLWSKRQSYGQANTLEIYLGATVVGRVKCDGDKTYQSAGGSFMWNGGITSITIKGTATGGDATAFISQFVLAKSALSLDDQRRNLASAFGGIYDPVGSVYALPADKIIAFVAALQKANL